MGAAPSHLESSSPPSGPGPVPPVAKRKRPGWLRWVVMAGVLIALIAAGLYWRSRVQNSITFESVPVENGSVQARVTATGNLNAVVEVLVSSQVSGNIKALYAD